MIDLMKAVDERIKLGWMISLARHKLVPVHKH